MCWVMPPASPDTTLALRMASRSEVLPWSTWPMMVTTGGRDTSSADWSSDLNRPSSISDSATRLTVWPNSDATSSAVSASMTSPGFMIWPCFMKNFTTSTARSDMRLARSWMVMVSGRTTSRTIFSRGSWCMARLNFSWRLRMADRERARASPSSEERAEVSVSLPRRRSSSPLVFVGLATSGVAMRRTGAAAPLRLAPRLARPRRPRRLRR